MKETKKDSKNIHECKNKKSFPGGSVVKNQPARESGLIPELGRSPGEGNGNPLQHSCLKTPMDRGFWWATVQSAAKNGTRLNN